MSRKRPKQRLRQDNTESPIAQWNEVLASAAELRKFQSAALKWYDRNGRKLPWRSTADPYRIWLSEIMLQQTTVAAVVPYFERFLAAFPTVRELAESDVDRVLRLWEGLGYYSRARNLHKAANEVCQRHAAVFPADVDALNALPGIGRYTAGAIASFAFDLPAPIVEANTERLYARILGLPIDVKSSAGQKALWDFATRIVPTSRAGDFNQTMMDLGANVCTPQSPKCSECPVSRFCKAFEARQQSEIPVRKARVAVTEIDEVAIVLCRNDQLLLRRRTPSERWAGMWDFPRFELPSDERSALDERLLQVPIPDAAESKTGRRTKSLFENGAVMLPDGIQERTHSLVSVIADHILATTQIRYSVTRYRVTLRAALCSAKHSHRTKRATDESTESNWFGADDLSDTPLSQTGRKIADWAIALLKRPTYQRNRPGSSNEGV